MTYNTVVYSTALHTTGTREATMDVEAQGGYRDDPDFDTLADTLADELFDISATNGRLWTLLRNNKSQPAGEMAADNRYKFKQLKDEIERLEQWPDAEPAQRFTQHKIAREFGEAFAEFQRIQQRLAEQKRKALEQQTSEAHHIEPDVQAIELDERQIQEQAFEEQLRQDEISYQAGLVQEREEEIQNIEQGVRDLNEMFHNLSTVVAQQGTVLDNIEANIFNVSQNTRDGSGQLLKAARWQRRSSGRQLCFLLILLILALVIVVSVTFG